jgi:chromosome segregation ATPase
MKISSVDINNEFQKLREEINKKIDEIGLNGTESFSEKEKESWYSKLDELYTQINELKKEHDLTKQELNQIKREIESAKKDMSVYPKKTWLKIFGQKFVTIFTRFHKSDAAKEIAKETTKTFLIESIKNII